MVTQPGTTGQTPKPGFDKVMPAELEARGVREAAAVCSSVMSDLVELTHPEDTSRAENIDDVFRRLSSA